MRVTHKMISTRTTGDLQEGLEGIQDAIDKVSTGRKIRSLSGEPSQLLSVMSLRKDFSINVQHISNNDKASFRLNQIDSVIGQVNDTMFLLKQFATDISSKIGNIEASAELNNMRSQFKQIANTKILNQYIFAGTKTSAPAFVEQNGKILYQGNTEKIELEIGPDEKMQVNMIGSEVFGSDDIGLFKVMETLSNLVDQKDLGIVDETTKHSISSGQLLTANGDLAATSTKLTDLAGIDVTDTILLSGQSSLPTGEGTVVNRTISFWASK
jgi:flagellar hook-associated protein 3 FlgL